MGTLFNQPERLKHRVELNDLETQVQAIKVIADKNAVSYERVLATYKLLEYQRRTEVMVDNGVIWDEQIAGMCELIKEINETISDAILKAEEE